MNAIIALKKAKSYVDETLKGSGALKGKNVQVAKIEPVIGGNRITFSYFTDDDVEHSSALEVMNGEQGVSVVSAHVGEGNLLTFTLSNSETITAGVITVDTSNLDLDNYYTKKQSADKFIQRFELNELIEDYFNENFIAVTQEEIKNLF